MSIVGCRQPGCVQNEIFTRGFEHFVVKVGLKREEPTMLISGGHHSYTRSISDLARRIILLKCECLPSQLTSYSPWAIIHWASKKNISSSVYDCTVEDVEYIYNKLSIHIQQQNYSHRLNLL